MILAKRILLYAGYALLGLVGIICFVFIFLTTVVESKDPVSSPPSTTQYVSVGNERLAYREIDNHALTTVVFVGGLSAWSETWERTMHALNAQNSEYNYLAIDLPPFGYSVVDPSRGYYRNVQADRIAGIVEGLKLSNVILVGHSYGAGPATEYALRHTGTVKKLVIVDGVLNIDEPKTPPPGGIVHIGAIRTVLLGLLAHSSSFVRHQFKSFVYVKDSVTEPLMAVYTRYFNTKGTTYRLSNWLSDYLDDPLRYLSTSSNNYKKLHIPVRLIWGEEDTITPPALTRVVLDSAPDSSLEVLPGVGHIPMVENPEVFQQALVEALGR